MTFHCDATPSDGRDVAGVREDSLPSLLAPSSRNVSGRSGFGGGGGDDDEHDESASTAAGWAMLGTSLDAAFPATSPPPPPGRGLSRTEGRRGGGGNASRMDGISDVRDSGDDEDGGDDDDDDEWPSSLDGSDDDGTDDDNTEAAVRASPSAVTGGAIPKENDDDEESSFVIRSWTPATTHLLLPRRRARAGAGASAPHPSLSLSLPPPPPSPSVDVLDRAFGSAFPRLLRSELESGGLLRRLRPARTAMDGKTDDLLGAIAKFVVDGDGSEKTGAEGGRGANDRLADNGGGMVRGDFSAFVPRSTRLKCPASFRREHPHLNRLIRSIEVTAMKHLGCAVEDSAVGGRNSDQKQGGAPPPHILFDPSLTSVQLAVYPGDGRSGYVRHCDTGPRCRSEAEDEAEWEGTFQSEFVASARRAAGGRRSNDASKADDGTMAGRIVTAVYYLTDDDWDETEDGGCLRVYQPPSLTTMTTSSSSTVTKSAAVDSNGTKEVGTREQYYDVVPYPDRLVVFRSDAAEHEVLPSLRRERTAVTVWLYGRVRNVVGVDGGGVVESEDGAGRRGAAEEEEDTEADRRSDEPAAASFCGANVGSPALASLTIHEAAEAGARTVVAGTSDGPPPLPLPQLPRRPPPQQKRRRPRIFVSIPAYRDPEAHPTILSLLSTAVHPERVRVGIVYQVDTTTDSHCFEPPLPSSWARTNLRSVTLDHRSAAGPCPARALAGCLLGDEEYVLMIDSHMRFRPHWDEYLIGQINKCDRPEWSVLTAYPPGYALVADDEGTEAAVDPDSGGTILVPWKFDEDGMLRQKGRRLPARRLRRRGGIDDGNNSRDDDDDESDDDRPIPCPFYAAGFAFLPSSAARDVPYDPSLRHLFFGEELSMAARLHRAGYDLHAPGAEAVVYHLWSRDYRRTLNADLLDAGDGDGRGGGDNADAGADADDAAFVSEARRRSLSTVRAQLRGDFAAARSVEPRGLGTTTMVRRSAADFAALVGADFEAGTLLLVPPPSPPSTGAGDGSDALPFGRVAPSGGLRVADDGGVGGGDNGRVGGSDGDDAKEVMGLVAAFLGG